MTPLRAALALVACFLAASGCDEAEDPVANGSAEGGKADDAAAAGLGVSFPLGPATVRSLTIEGASHSVPGSDGTPRIFAQRVIVEPPSATHTIEIAVESLEKHRHDFSVDDAALVLSRRPSSDAAWTTVSELPEGLTRALIDHTTGSVSWTALDEDGDQHGGSIDLHDAAGAQWSLEVVPHEAILGDDADEEHDLVYRLHVSCDGQVCRAPVDARPFPDRIALGSPTLFHKSGAYHPSAPETGGPAIYLGSLGDGTITRLDPDGGTPRETVIVAGQPDTSTIGVALDLDEDRLWACAVDNTLDHLPGALWAFDLESGERIGDYDLSGAAPQANCNEVFVAASGTVYTSDRQNGRIYRVDHERARVETFADDDRLEQGLGDPLTVGLNGIVVTPAEDRVLVVHYNPSVLLTAPIERDASGPAEVSEVDMHGTSGSFNPLTIIPSGPASLQWLDGALLAVYPSELVRITPMDEDWSAAWYEVLELDVPGSGLEDEWLTGQILVEGELYLTNGQTGPYLTGGDPEPFFLQRVGWDVLDR